LEKYGKDFGIQKFSVATKNEFIEYKNGEEFVESPLIKYFLMPVWLEFLDEKEKEQVIDKLAQKINDEHGEISFRMSIKATLLGGRKS